MSLSPDHELAFVGEGGSLAMLGIGASAGSDAVCFKARLPLDLACVSLLPLEKSVVLCGGKMGLYELVTCPGLGDSCAAQCTSYPLNAIDTVDGKFCVAAVAVHGHAAGDLLLALYSAKDDSEVRVYDLAAPHALRSATAVQGGAGSQGFDLAADPLNPNLVYAALGSGGLARLDLGDLGHIAVESGPIFDRPDQMLNDKPASARSLAVAGGFLYAAGDRGGLVEIDLAAPWSPGMGVVYQVLGCGSNTIAFAYRVAALEIETGHVLIAVGSNESSAQQIEGGPFSLVGSWDFMLGVGNTPGPQPGDPDGCPSRLYLFDHEPAAPGAPQGNACAPGGLCQLASLDGSTDQWRSVWLRKQGPNYQVVECRRSTFRLLDLGPHPFQRDALTYTLLGTHTSIGLAPVDGVVSAVDKNVLYMTNDAAGSTFAGMLSIGPADSAFGVVPDTSGLCALTTNTAEYCDTLGPALDVPEPHRNSLFSTAHWIDESDPTREWFVAGQSSLYEQCAATCGYTDQWCQSIWRAQVATSWPTPGWKVVSFLPSVENGAQWQLRWWQLPAPQKSNGNAGRNYIGSTSDPRPDSKLLHLTRSGIAEGYIVCDHGDLVSNAEALCPSNNGRGQIVGTSWMHVLSTHPEFAETVPVCAASENLALTTACRVFSVDAGGSTHWVAGLTAGFPSNPCASSAWLPYYQRPMVVFYDVTDVDADHPPQLLRLAFGQEGTPGNAFALEIQELGGRTYAFVTDLGGRLLLFDVSGDVLYPAPANPAVPSTGLAPVATWTCPISPFDGFRDNVINLVVDLPHVYLATGRRGITILEATANPLQLHEIEHSPELTPGLALGLVLRKQGSATTLIVGDSRAGLRLYARPPN